MGPYTSALRTSALAMRLGQVPPLLGDLTRDLAQIGLTVPAQYRLKLQENFGLDAAEAEPVHVQYLQELFASFGLVSDILPTSTSGSTKVPLRTPAMDAKRQQLLDQFISRGVPVGQIPIEVAELNR